MGISQEFLIDLALNAGGYLLAGMLGMVIFSLFARRRKTPVPAGTSPASSAGDESTVTVTNEGRRLEFVKLGEGGARAGSINGPETSRRADAAADRRDRAETIRVARSMLKAGASHETIKRVIPVSDAELSLLSMSKC